VRLFCRRFGAAVTLPLNVHVESGAAPLTPTGSVFGNAFDGTPTNYEDVGMGTASRLQARSRRRAGTVEETSGTMIGLAARCTYRVWITMSIESNNETVNKRLMILGGSSGIGLAVARAALGEGASVVVSSDKKESVDRAHAALSLQASLESSAQIVDVSSEHAVEAFLRGAPPLDHLIYTAGDDLPLAHLENTDLSVAQRHFQIRYWGALAAAKYGRPSIREGGSIILTSGFSAGQPQPGWSSQASIQSAVEGLTRALAVELAPIRVNAVSPGLSQTPRWDAMPASVREPLYESEAKRLPLRRLGTAAEIATAYLYLMENSYATGTIIIVDGGGAIA